MRIILFVNLIFPAVPLCFQNHCPACDFAKGLGQVWVRDRLSDSMALPTEVARGTQTKAPVWETLAIPGNSTVLL